MTPSDELWIDMAQYDTHLADGIWDGTAAPDDPPPWYGDVATLIRAAKAPARPDELAAEDQIVALMRQTILEAAADSPADAGAPAAANAPGLAEAPPSPSAAAATPVEVAKLADAGAPIEARAADTRGDIAGEKGGQEVGAGRRQPRHLRAVEAGPGAAGDGDDEAARPLHLRAAAGRGRAGRVVRRVVAVKAVAVTTAVAIGITAAAATTGIVTVVVPAARDRLLKDDTPSGEVVDEDAPSGDSGPRSDGTYEVPRSCDRDAPSCTTPDGTRIDPQTGEPLGTTETTVAGDGGATTETTVPGDDPTSETPGDTPSTTVDPATGEPTVPTTDTTVPTTDTTVPTTETPTTTEPEVEPRSDPGDGQAAADPSAVGLTATQG